jgi:hypothetical protein
VVGNTSFTGDWLWFDQSPSSGTGIVWGNASTTYGSISNSGVTVTVTFGHLQINVGAGTLKIWDSAAGSYKTGATGTDANGSKFVNGICVEIH